jgi:hypothetical protein
MRASIGRNAGRTPTSNRIGTSRPDQLSVLHPAVAISAAREDRPAIRRPHPRCRPSRQASLLLARPALASSQVGPIDLLVVAAGIAAAFYLKYRISEKYEPAGRLITEGLRASIA